MSVSFHVNFPGNMWFKIWGFLWCMPPCLLSSLVMESSRSYKILRYGLCCVLCYLLDNMEGEEAKIFQQCVPNVDAIFEFLLRLDWRI